MRYGMSERLGPRVFGHDRGQPFLGRDMGSEPDYSDEIAREIDDEIRRVVEEAHQSAKDILNDRRERLEEISKILLARETIDAQEFIKLMDGASEEDVFGARDDAEEAAEAEAERTDDEVAKPAEREGPRTLPRPRPGFAGGAAEMRSPDGPSEPDRS